MSFTRRNVAIRSSSDAAARTPSHQPAIPDRGPIPTRTAPEQSRAPPPARHQAPSSEQQQQPQQEQRRPPGTRPSPVDGRLTTSTGCLSFDGLLAGHAGLALGQSVLLAETGTTDYASTLLRYFAAEGVVQGHAVHVVGVPEGWGRELPGQIGSASASASAGDERRTEGRRSEEGEGERMKIAWRYERLGEFGAASGRARPSSNPESTAQEDQNEIFCHAFDLTKRLTFPPSYAGINFIQVQLPASGELLSSSASTTPPSNPFPSIIEALTTAIKNAPDTTIHRIIIPSLLSPAIYPTSACTPSHLLPFLHSIRALRRIHSSRVCCMFSLPLALYPRSTGLTRWIELLSDGVLELAPFPHRFDNDVSAEGSALGTSGAATRAEDRPQGLLRVHRLPVFHEGGGGGAGEGVDEDLAFIVSRKKFVIRPFSLPPVDGDQEAQRGEQSTAEQGDNDKGKKSMPRKEDLEF